MFVLDIFHTFVKNITLNKIIFIVLLQNNNLKQ